MYLATVIGHIATATGVPIVGRIVWPCRVAVFD